MIRTLVAILVCSFVAPAQLVEAKVEYLGTNSCGVFSTPEQFEVLPGDRPILNSLVGIRYFVPVAYAGQAFLAAGCEVDPPLPLGSCDVFSDTLVFVPLRTDLANPIVFLFVPDNPALLGFELVVQEYLAIPQDASRGIRFTVGDF